MTAELKFDVPLAELDEWGEGFTEYTGTGNESTDIAGDCENCVNPSGSGVKDKKKGIGDGLDFGETFSGSLEDLVNSFDEKVTNCFKDYDENTEAFAPVQIRTQEEIMNECPMWWTITGNYGNILPIDWSKSYARTIHMPTLNLSEQRKEDLGHDLPDDEELAQQLDMHSLIISSLHQEPMVTADDVLEEIDEIMQQDTPSSEDPESPCKSSCDVLGIRDDEEHLNLEERLQCSSLAQLQEVVDDLECTIRAYSETLVEELALRDELEFEKELKNQFISLLLSIQNKRRQVHSSSSHHHKSAAAKFIHNSNILNGNSTTAVGSTSTTTTNPGMYLTTVIPYQTNQGPPPVQTLQILIKILKAIDDDSSAVPGLLTDYILKVLCPTTAVA